jgi:hypothetical protein
MMEHHATLLLVLLCTAVLWPSETPMRRLIAWTQAVSGIAVAAVVLTTIAAAVIGLLLGK